MKKKIAAVPGALGRLAALAAPAAADEAPKRGGTLTYMIPADAPPSFDASARRPTRRSIRRRRSTAC